MRVSTLSTAMSGGGVGTDLRFSGMIRRWRCQRHGKENEGPRGTKPNILLLNVSDIVIRHIDHRAAIGKYMISTERVPTIRLASPRNGYQCHMNTESQASRWHSTMSRL
jgi:hypothetical protein